MTTERLHDSTSKNGLCGADVRQTPSSGRPIPTEVWATPLSDTGPVLPIPPLARPHAFPIDALAGAGRGAEATAHARGGAAQWGWPRHRRRATSAGPSNMCSEIGAPGSGHESQRHGCDCLRGSRCWASQSASFWSRCPTLSPPLRETHTHTPEVAGGDVAVIASKVAAIANALDLRNPGQRGAKKAFLGLGVSHKRSP